MNSIAQSEKMEDVPAQSIPLNPMENIKQDDVSMSDNSDFETLDDEEDSENGYDSDSSSISSYSSGEDTGLIAPPPVTTLSSDYDSENKGNSENDFNIDDFDLYSRRSGRSRKNIQRFEEVVEDDFFSDDSDAPGIDDEEDEDFDEEIIPVVESSSEEILSDDDDFDYGRRRSTRKTTRKSRRSTRSKKKKKSYGDSEDENIYVRRSNRNTERISYVAESDSSESSEIEVAPKPEIIGDVIERILDKREVDRENGDGTKSKTVEYLVKWKGWAHIHNSWDTEQYLKDFHGFKKILNYNKNIEKEKELKILYGEDSAEDIEQANILKEMEKRRLKEWTKVERIVASKEVLSNDGEYETYYFVKWKGLSYDQNTWELPKDIEKFQDKIDSFLAREQHTFSRRNKGWRTNRPKVPELKEQPPWLDHAGTLRYYQLEGLNWLIQCWCNNINSILADEMGLGKTIQTVSFLSWLHFAQEIPGPFLVVVPLSTVDNWMKEFQKWAPGMNVVLYIGNSASRQIIREYEFGTQKHMKVHAIVTTFELVLKDKLILQKYKWVYLAVDEAHRLKNCESQLHETLLSFNTDNRLLITGTPLQNSLRELWSLLSFLHPKKFSSMIEFENKYLNIDTAENQDKIQSLHAEIGPHLLRRYKKQVEKSLPSKTERILRVELSPMQKMYYKLILARNVEQLNKSLMGKGKKASLINIVVELRKCCNHPYLFNGAEEMITRNKNSKITDLLIKSSGKLLLMHKLLTRLKETGHRVLIFSQMVRMLDILADYLASQHFNFQRLDGSMNHDMRRQAMESFNDPDSKDFCFLLSTRAGGLGINLSTADTVIIYDSDWNPQNDLQAVARAHRIGQKKVVNIYRLVSQHTVEEEILERAKKKMVLDHLVIQRMDSGSKVLSDTFTSDEFSSILQFSAQHLFKDSENNNNDNSTTTTTDLATEAASEKNEENDLDLDEILSRAEETEDHDTGPISAAEELLSSFRVSTLKTNFNDTEENTDSGKSDPNFWKNLLPPVEETTESEILTPRRRTVTSYAEFGNNNIKSDDDNSLLGKRSRNSSLSSSSRPSKKQKIGYDNNPLTEKEVRLFVRAFRRYANPDRIDEISSDAGLLHKSKELLEKTCLEIFDLCKDACLKSKSNAYIDYHSISVNATELIQRYDDIKQIEKKIETYDSPNSFRMNIKIKPASFPGCIWTVKDDNMLIWGAYHHGIGNWDKIKKDELLGLDSKISIAKDEPGVKGSQLQRRLDGLFRALRNEKKARDIKNEKKTTASTQSSKKVKKSSSISKTKKTESKKTSRKTPRRKSTSESETPKSKRKSTKNEEPIDPKLLSKASSLLRGSRSIIRDFRDLSKRELSDDERIKETKRCLITIGNNIDNAIQSHRNKDKLQRHLWHYVADKTGNQKGSILQSLYERLQ